MTRGKRALPDSLTLLLGLMPSDASEWRPLCQGSGFRVKGAFRVGPHSKEQRWCGGVSPGAGRLWSKGRSLLWGGMQLETPEAAEAERWKDWEYSPFMCLLGCSGHRWKQRSDKLESAQSSLTPAISCEDGRISREDKTQEGSQRRENDAHPHCLINITVVEAARYNPQRHFTKRQKLKKLSRGLVWHQYSTGPQGSAAAGENGTEDQWDRTPCTGGQSWDQEHLLLKKKYLESLNKFYSFIAVLVTCSVAGGQRVQNNDSQRKSFLS